MRGKRMTMKKSVLPQPKRRTAPSFSSGSAAASKPLTGQLSGQPVSGQRVEIALGDLAGTRGTVIKASGADRWLIKLDGTCAGVLLVIRRQALRLLSAQSS
jgi:hypothetical protein